jgi:hypothetical protein
MHHVAPSESLQNRVARAPIKHPIRVTIAGTRVVRVLSGDISPNGMFLQMADPPERGTVVTMAFEAKGQVLPFAEGEVAWGRGGASGGFGVRFTRFLHPNARSLVDYLSENLTTGAPLLPRQPVQRSRHWQALAASAAVIAGLVTWATMPSHEAPPPPAPVVVAAPPPPPPAEKVAVQSAPPPAPASIAPKKRAQTRLQETPRATPVMTRTLGSAVKPAPFSSTAIPSGAARLVNVSRVSGALRVAVETVALGRVTAVNTLQNPARLIVDVAGLPPVNEHQLALSDPELRGVIVKKQGTGTRLVFELARLPTRVTQQGDSALLHF